MLCNIILKIKYQNGYYIDVQLHTCKYVIIVKIIDPYPVVNTMYLIRSYFHKDLP